MDPVHGTDCPEWYLYAAEHLSDEDFRTSYGNRLHLLHQDMPEKFEPFLIRLASLQA